MRIVDDTRLIRFIRFIRFIQLIQDSFDDSSFPPFSVLPSTKRKMLDSDSFDSFLPWKFSNFGDSDWVDQGNRALRAGVHHDDTVPPFMIQYSYFFLLLFLFTNAYVGI